MGLLLILTALLPLVVLPGNDDPARLPQTVLLQVGVLALWLLELGKAQRQAGSPRSGTRWLVSTAGVLLAWAALSLAWGRNRYDGIAVLARWSAAFLLLLLAIRLVKTARDARLLLLALFSSSVIVSGIGLLQHVAGWEALPQAFPPAGTLGNKNLAAAFVALAMPGGLVAFLSAAPLASWALSAALAVDGAFLVHAGSRAAIAAVAVQIAGLAAFRLSGRLPSLPRPRRAAVAAGLAVFVALAQLPPREGAAETGLWAATTRPLARLLETGQPQASPGADNHPRAERSVEMRLAIWRNSLAMLGEHPILGVGLGNFNVEYPRYASAGAPDGTRLDQWVESAHNDYLQLAAELGLVGSALAGLLAWAGLRILLAAARHPAADVRWIAAACGLGLAAAIAMAAATATLTHPALLAAPALLLGICSALGPAPAAPSPAVSRQPLSFTNRLPRFACAALLCVASGWGVAEIIADRHVLDMAYAESAADWQQVVTRGLRARQWNAFRRDAPFAVASAYVRLGQPADAIPLLEELLARYPNHANALGNLGIARLATGDLERAADSFKRVLALRPDDALARRNLYRVEKRRGDSL